MKQKGVNDNLDNQPFFKSFSSLGIDIFSFLFVFFLFLHDSLSLEVV